MFVAHSSNNGDSHTETHLSNSSIGFRWDGDDFQIQQTGTGAPLPNVNYAVYTMNYQE